MKLSPVRIQQTLEQLVSRTEVVPETHPKAAELHEIFGEHTFFLDEDGLEIVEPAVAGTAEDAGKLVKLAMWNDAARTVLTAHPAEVTDVVIHFAAQAPENDETDPACTTWSGEE